MITYIDYNRLYRIGEIEDLSLGFVYSLSETNITDKKYFPVFPNSFRGKCTIEVYGNEGSNIPHFHITSIDRKFSCCIQLFDNRFFTHGTHKDILHKKDWEILDAWLRTENKRNSDNSNWKEAKEIWQYLYSDYRFNDYEQPDYTTIKLYKEK